MTIVHEPAASRFVVHLPEGAALLEYTLESDAAVFTHTFVPSAARGQGVAEALVRTALTWAREQKLRVVASCSYVARFIERHPDLVRQDI
jgi:uncharacterized protein